MHAAGTPHNRSINRGLVQQSDLYATDTAEAQIIKRVWPQADLQAANQAGKQRRVNRPGVPHCKIPSGVRNRGQT